MVAACVATELPKTIAIPHKICFAFIFSLLSITRVGASEPATPVTLKCSNTYRKLTRPLDPTGHAPAKQGDPFAPDQHILFVHGRRRCDTRLGQGDALG